MASLNHTRDQDDTSLPEQSLRPQTVLEIAPYNPSRAVTRVMSPTLTQSGVLSRVRATCQLCGTLAEDPVVCASCGAFGHPDCLRMEVFLEHAFCGSCIGQVTSEYASFQDAHRREAWRRSLQEQVGAWKTRAIEAIGVSSSIGVAMGGAVVAAAGVAAGLAQGAVRGAAAASSVPQLALPSTTDTPALEGSSEPLGSRAGKPSDSSVEDERLEVQRVASAGSRPPTRCPMCWTPGLGRVRPIQHTDSGDCKLAFPSPTSAATIPAA